MAFSRKDFIEKCHEKISFALFLFGAFCAMLGFIAVTDTSNPLLIYNDNYDKNVGGGRVSYTTSFIITSYLHNSNQCDYGKYQLIGKRYNFTSIFETSCVINNNICYKENELLENYNMGTIHDISYDITKTNECLTVKYCYSKIHLESRCM